DCLLYFRALNLEDRGSWIRFVAAVAVRGDDTKLRHLEGLQLDLNRRDLNAEALVLDQRPFAHTLHGGELLQTPDSFLRQPDTGKSEPLIAEQKLGIIPALVLLADEILKRYLHVVEEDLVHFAAAVDGLDWPHGHTRSFHIDEQERDSFLFLRLRI